MVAGGGGRVGVQPEKVVHAWETTDRWSGKGIDERGMSLPVEKGESGGNVRISGRFPAWISVAGIAGPGNPRNFPVSVTIFQSKGGSIPVNYPPKQASI